MNNVMLLLSIYFVFLCQGVQDKRVRVIYMGLFVVIASIIGKFVLRKLI